MGWENCRKQAASIDDRARAIDIIDAIDASESCHLAPSGTSRLGGVSGQGRDEMDRRFGMRGHRPIERDPGVGDGCAVEQEFDRAADRFDGLVFVRFQGHGVIDRVAETGFRFPVFNAEDVAGSQAAWFVGLHRTGNPEAGQRDEDCNQIESHQCPFVPKMPVSALCE